MASGNLFCLGSGGLLTVSTKLADQLWEWTCLTKCYSSEFDVINRSWRVDLGMAENKTHWCLDIKSLATADYSVPFKCHNGAQASG